MYFGINSEIQNGKVVILVWWFHISLPKFLELINSKLKWWKAFKFEFSPKKLKMLEQYEKAAKALDIDIGKIMLDVVRPLIRDEELRE